MKNIKDYDLEDLKKELIGLGEKAFRAEQIFKWLYVDKVKNFEIRGIGLIWGVETHDGNLAKKISMECFKNGLIVERAGRNNSVVKLMPALTIDDETLMKGLNILKETIAQ